MASLRTRSWRGVVLAVAAVTLATALGVATVRDLTAGGGDEPWSHRRSCGGYAVRPPPGADVGPPRLGSTSPCYELSDRELDLAPEVNPFRDRVPHSPRQEHDLPCVVARGLVEAPAAFVHVPFVRFGQTWTASY